MQHRFFALISRMRYIGRWGLMRNTFEENVQEHSHMVAVLAHGLALIQRDILHEPADPDRCASAARFHDAGWKDGAWHDVTWFEREIAPHDGAPKPLRPIGEVGADEVLHVCGQAICERFAK